MRKSQRQDVGDTCPCGQLHQFVRQVRDHPDRPGMRQDRMVCTHCSAVPYEWGRAFK